MGNRGPPPKQLIRLFWLIKENPSATDLELSNALGIEPEAVNLYKWRLRNLKCDITSFCPNCFEKGVWQDPENGERVCRSCGFVLEREASMIHTLPFGETYALTNNIAYGKSLGGTLSKNATYRVLARTRDAENKANVPIRQIYTIAETFDPPVVINMLAYASKLLKNLGFDSNDRLSAILANELGGALRRIGAFLTISRVCEVFQPHLLARAAVWLTLKKFGFIDQAEECRKKYAFPETEMKLLLKIEELTELTLEKLGEQNLEWKAKPLESASWRPSPKK